MVEEWACAQPSIPHVGKLGISEKGGETVLEDGGAVLITAFCSAALSAVALLPGVLCFVE